MHPARKPEYTHEELFQRRRHLRIPIELEGRMMLSDSSEHRCVTRNISPGGLELSAGVRPTCGETIVAYIAVLGRIEGKVARLTPGGFALRLSSSQLKRDKLATQLTWLINKDVLELHDQRESVRMVADGNPMTVEAAGVHYSAEIIDFSVRGVAFHSAAPLRVGDIVQLNQNRCMIIRVSDEGYGAAFMNTAPGLTRK